MMYSFPLRALAACVLCLGLLAPATATGHEIEAQRSVVAKVYEDRVEIMVIYAEPAGPRTALLLGRFDVNSDRKLEGIEATLAAREVFPLMMAGLQFEVEGERPRGGEPEVKFKVGRDGELSMATLVRYDLSALPFDATRTLHVRVLRADGSLPTEVVVGADSALKIIEANRPKKSDLTLAPILLERGQHVTVVFGKQVLDDATKVDSTQK